MKRFENFHLYIMLFIIVACCSCVTSRISRQVEMQNLLLSPQLSNTCWVLQRQTDSTEVVYYLKYYQYFFEENDHIENATLTNMGRYKFGNATEQIHLLTRDYSSEHIIENDATDCSVHLDINEQGHLFFRTADYPDFMRKRKVAFTNFLNNPLVQESGSDARSPNMLNASSYYYEELYFEANGNFRKKVFLDRSCNFLLVTGKWIFKNAEASSDGTTEIILEYDLGNRIGIPAKDNVYNLAFEDDILRLSKKYTDTNAAFLATRSHYSIIKDEIKFTPNAKLPQLRNGKVVSHERALCTAIGENPDDKIIVDDPLTLVKNQNYFSEAYYSKKMRRCPDTTKRDTVINTTAEQNIKPDKSTDAQGMLNAYLAIQLSNLSGDPSHTPVGGMQVGIETHLVDLSDNIDLGIGAAYSMQGGNSKSYTYIPGGDYSNSNVTTRLGYLNLPVLLHYKKNDIGWFAEAGLQPGILLNAKKKGTETSDVKAEYKKFDVGIPVRLGYHFKNKFSAALQVTPGLLNISKNNKNHNMVLSLSAAYRLR
jgi:hypothetical protein